MGMGCNPEEISAGFDNPDENLGLHERFGVVESFVEKQGFELEKLNSKCFVEFGWIQGDKSKIVVCKAAI